MDEKVIVQRYLAKWYGENARELPWRETRDPYLIWISEVILQQTRVAQGYDYYVRFVERFPTVVDLAEAHEDEVLKYWQGLGYYSRARNLHAAARQVVGEFAGVFPCDYAGVRSLKGVGDYTAAAVCSFAYNLPCAVVDGNVYRVLARLFGVDTPIDVTVGKKQFRQLADELLDEVNPALHNQAIMEFGALQCVPSGADCGICGLREVCVACRLGNVGALPCKEKKMKVRKRYFYYFVVLEGDAVYLVQRKEKDIWQKLYEFPMYESERELDVDVLLGDDELLGDVLGLKSTCGYGLQEVSAQMKHVLSHQHIYARFVVLRVATGDVRVRNGVKVPLGELERYAVPRLIEMFLEKTCLCEKK